MTPQYRINSTDAAPSPGSAWQDASGRGRLRFSGPDAASFLHALVTNDVASLHPGLDGCYAAWLTPQGRMITDLRLMRDADGVVAEVPAGMASELWKRFDQLIFSEQVSVVDESANTRALVVFGPGASGAVGAATGLGAAALDALPMFGHLTHDGLRVIRTDDVAVPNFAVWMPASRWESVVAALGEAGSVVAEPGLLEALRVETGPPRFGVDMTTETIPLEAGLLQRAISTTKGCYVGQEVIIRVLHRGGGRVAKHLVRMVAEGDGTVPAAGTPISDEGREVGSVTSAALGPESGQVVVLGYVHRDSAEVGRTVRVAQQPATISALIQ